MAKRDLKFFVKDLEKATVEGVRTACVEILNDLVAAGPAYSGEFSSSWYVVTPGSGPGGARSSTGLYKYDLRNVPKAKFNKIGQYTILNTAPHADVAMDLVPYGSQDFEDFGERVVTTKKLDLGKRNEGDTRGQVSGKGSNTSSAPPDWWPTFGTGGALSSAVSKGFSKGFVRFGKARGFG
jgi:hypothetical protein